MKKTIATVVITFICTSLLWLAIIVGAAYFYLDSESPLQVAIDAPTEVALGDSFDLVLDVVNAGDSASSMHSVDLFDRFMGGFEVVDAEPPILDDAQISNFRTLWFEHALQPGEAVTVRIRLKASQIGRHSGQIDVCTGLELCANIYETIEVVAADGAHIRGSKE